MLEYNTGRNQLVIKEYGRNVQKMIEQAIKIKDADKRSEAAKAIIRIMAQLNPDQRENLDHKKNTDSLDYWHKLWDHLFIMSNYQLDVDAPFPKPSPIKGAPSFSETNYFRRKISYRTYGRNLENIIATVSSYPEEVRAEMSKVLANQLKKMYLIYNRDSVEDKFIIQQLREISGGKLTLPDDFVLESTKEILRLNQMALIACKPINTKKLKRKKKKIL